MKILPPTLPRRTRRELAKYVIDSIRAAGIRFSSTSRLQRMCDLFDSGDSIIQPNNPEFEIALEALRDMQLLGFVFDHFGTLERSPSFLGLLHKMTKDSVLPQQDKLNSKGRDAAFELFVAAICKSAKFDPVSFEEPDVMCHLDNVAYGLAAKRIKSAKNIEDRVRKGIEQISRSGVRGVVVIDTCLAFNPNNDRVVEVLPDSVFMARYWRTLRDIWDGYQTKVQQLMSESKALGIIVHDYQVRYLDNRDWELTGITMRVPALSRSAMDQREFDKFATIYSFALPNQEDIANPKWILP